MQAIVFAGRKGSSSAGKRCEQAHGANRQSFDPGLKRRGQSTGCVVLDTWAWKNTGILRHICVEQKNAVQNLLDFCAGNQVLGKVLAYRNFIAAQRGIIVEKLLAQLVSS